MLLTLIYNIIQFNKTPLHYATESGHSNVVQTLLANGANIEAVVKVRMTDILICRKIDCCHVI